MSSILCSNNTLVSRDTFFPFPYPYLNGNTNAINPQLIAFFQFYGTIAIFSTIFINDVFNLLKCDKKYELPLIRNKYKKFLKSKRNVIEILVLIATAAVYFSQFLVIFRSNNTLAAAAFAFNFIFVLLAELPLEYFQIFKTSATSTTPLLYHLFNVLVNLINTSQFFCFNGKYSIIGNQHKHLVVAPLILHSYAFCYHLLYYKPIAAISDHFAFLKSNYNIFPPVNFIEDITFTWMNPIINDVYKKGGVDNPYTMDLPPSNLDVTQSYNNFMIQWDTESKDKCTPGKYYLLLTLLKIHLKLVVIAILYNTFADYIRVLQPMIIRKILLFLELEEKGANEYPRVHLLTLGLYVCSLNIMNSILNNQYFIKIFEVGLQVKSSIIVAVYRKNLKLSFKSKSLKKTGDVLNLISVDALKIQRFFEQSQPIIGLPVIIITTLTSLYQILGLAAIPGLVIMMVLVPLNSKLSTRLTKLFKQNMIFKDLRTKLITELLNNIKIVKIYNWQKPLISRLNKLRDSDELGNYASLNYFNALITFLWSMIPLLVACASFLSYSIINHKPLNANIIFTSVSLFNLLQECVQQLPGLITLVIESKVSLVRVQEFLLLEEIDDYFIHYEIRDTLRPLVEIKNCDFLWESSSTNNSDTASDQEQLSGYTPAKTALTNIEFKAYAGQLVVIIGRSGFGGKTTLLRSILGILPARATNSFEEAKLIYRTSQNEYEPIAYISQHPWLMNASIKDNITFGKKYDEKLYEKIITICQLLPDLKIFADGDKTIVGGQGVSCSFGQLVRINICRALYSQAEIYVFDDVLSALDASVGQAIIDNVFNDFLKDKCVIFATNSMKVLKHADVIYYLENCSISRVTKYAEIMDSIDDYKLREIKELILEHDKGSKEINDSDDVIDSEEEIACYSKEHVAANYDLTGDIYEENELDEEINDLPKMQRSLSNSSLHPKRPLIATINDNLKTKQNIEKIGKGKIKYQVYLLFLKNCGWKNVCYFLLFSALLQGSDVLQKLWLKYWSDVGEDSVTNLKHYVFVYFILGLFGAVFESFRTVSLNIWCLLTASGNLHRQMLKSVIDSPMSFFETTKASIILNRFTADISTLDEALEWCLASTVRNTMLYICCVVIISISIPIWLVVNIALIALYTYYQLRYVVLSRDLRRFWAISFSPVIASLEELINGMDAIKNYQQVGRFDFFNNENIQFNVDVMWSFRSTNRWIAIRLQSGSALVVLFITIFAIIKKDVKASLIAFLMNYAVQISNALMWIIRSSVAIETNSVSVERVIEFCELPPEKPLALDGDCNLPKNWPQAGLIEFKDYSTTYRPNLDPSLKNLNLIINPGEKIAICGRSGSGKSTLTLSLFRILEPLTGQILIDNVDISKVGLSALRSGISIIPQTGDGQVFEGTLRYNLDPFNNYTDERLINALELSHLKPHIEKISREDRFYENQTPESNPTALMDPVTTEQLLNAKIADNGSNLSVGTKQLLCLARALLSDNNILILDEASAALDEVTDALIQKTIKDEFKHKTVITIAHRLNTILSDSDRVMVLDKGKLQEFDSPKTLIQKEEGLFYELCKKGGYI
ncbi:hypothetical protein QEN19_001772 [Hanseniaspora menglaensis]